MAQVTIYSTPTCMYCKAAKEYFAENNVAYDEHDVSTDADKRQEMIDRSGQMGVPVIFIKKDDAAEPEMIIGFNKDKIAELLGM